MSEDSNVNQTPLSTQDPEEKTSEVRGRNPRRYNFRRANGNENKKFEGETAELGVFLWLHSERLDKGVPFKQFQDNLKNYILKNFGGTEDIVNAVTTLVDPTSNFKAIHSPADLTDEEVQNQFKVKCGN